MFVTITFESISFSQQKNRYTYKNKQIEHVFLYNSHIKREYVSEFTPIMIEKERRKAFKSVMKELL
jgi:hypothetical protein